MKCSSFPLFMISRTASLCAVLLFCSGSIGLAADSGLDIAKIESITGLKGVLNEKENTFKVSKPRNDVGTGFCGPRRLRSHRSRPLDSGELADRDLSRAVIQAADFPLSTSGDMLSSLYRLFQAVRAKSTVALSGESSDEVFGGYPWFHDPKAIDAATFPWVAAEVLENRSHPARSLLIFHYAEKACSAQGIQYWPAQRINGKLCTTERDGVFGFPEGD